MRIPGRTLTSICALALGLAACAGDDAGDSTDGTDGAEVTATESVLADDDDGSAEVPDDDPATESAEDGAPGDVLAASASSALGRSSRSTIESTVVGPEGEVTVTGEIRTAANGDSAVTLSFSGDGAQEMPAGSIETRVVGGTTYTRVPGVEAMLGPGVEWLSFSEGDAMQGAEGLTGPADQVDAASLLSSLQDAGDVTEVGTEDVNGVATTHYRAVLDGASVADQGVAADVAEQLPDEVPIEVWIDGDGLLRRIVQSFEAGGTSSTTTIEVLEYDIDVTVEAPPAASTVTLEDMMSGVPQG